MRSWKHFFPIMTLVGLVFLVWDHWFTEWGIWSFNPEYLVGIYIGKLPLEEVLFFFTVPFACVFIYEVLRTYLPKDYLRGFSTYISTMLAVVLIALSALHLDKLYTAVTFSAAGTLLLYLTWLARVPYLGWFFMAFIVSVAPFMFVNGLLTGMPVVIYNNAENLGLRIFSIPVEDLVYSLLLLLSNVSGYEYLKRRHANKILNPVLK